MRHREIPPDALWLALLVAGAVGEIEAIRRGKYDHTASRTARRWWRVHTPTGRVAFLGGWLGFAAWFAAHVVRGGSDADHSA